MINGPSHQIMQEPHSLTVIIVAKNEERNITECVARASFVDEVLVFDSSRSASTVAPATAAGAPGLQTDWPGRGPEVACGLLMARCAHRLSQDADERITAVLRPEIESVVRSDAHDGDRIPRLSDFCGQFIRLSGWRPDRVLRLGRHGTSSFTDHLPHTHMTMDDAIGTLRSSMIRVSRPHLHGVTKKLDRYSGGQARDKRADGKRCNVSKGLMHGVFALFRNCVLRLGSLVGQHGLMLSVSKARVTVYAYLKLMHFENPPRRPEFPA